MFFVSILGGSTTPRGHWHADHSIISVSVLGGARLDLSQAILDEGDTRVIIFSLLSGTRIAVPRDVPVMVDGVSIMGGRHVEVDQDAEVARDRRIRITAFAALGGVRVESAH